MNGIPRIGFMKGGKSAIWNEKTMAADILAKVKAYIDTVPQGKPFFLYYGLHEPHVPRVPASQFEGKSATGARGDVVIEADWCVGETMKYLKEKGLDDNTIVIFTSDNGPVLVTDMRTAPAEHAPYTTPTADSAAASTACLRLAHACLSSCTGREKSPTSPPTHS